MKAFCKTDRLCLGWFGGFFLVYLFTMLYVGSGYQSSPVKKQDSTRARSMRTRSLRRRETFKPVLQ